MIMTTINAITGSAEGVGLNKVDSFKTAIEAIVDVVKAKIENNETLDLADSQVLDEVQTKAVAGAVKGVQAKKHLMMQFLKQFKQPKR